MICSLKPLLKLYLISLSKKLEKLGFKGFLVGFINWFQRNHEKFNRSERDDEPEKERERKEKKKKKIEKKQL